MGEAEQIVKYTQSIKNKVSKKCTILIIAEAISKSYSSDGNMYYEVDYDFLLKIFTEEEIKTVMKNAITSKLKAVIREIVEGAKEDGHGFTPGSKTYMSKKIFI